ncbi:hypothetical protein [[Mycobacterium] crassicus]|uniref:PE family protein n=1 Tax=[Mycobacterium] crassicus TaxID=2872309 RepID=A0ABU5XK59_9MYCO|nr:hypothetical protein [Mycolicibacter sp. MYC098]MEB3022660.1 hypothetical protein [Mycolicibacter sp. MYC098]
MTTPTAIVVRAAAAARAAGAHAAAAARAAGAHAAAADESVHRGFA